MTDNATLREVLENKLRARIDAGMARSKDAFEQIEREGSLLTDSIVRLPQIQFDANGSLSAHIGDRKLRVHKHALGQFAEKYGAPAKYLNELQGSEWGRSLSATILNQHGQNVARERVLLRSVGDQVRGVLSDKYKRFDSGLLYSAFIQGTRNEGLSLYDAHISDTQVWMEAVSPVLFTIPTAKNGEIHVSYGARLSHSDFGDGALDVKFFMIQAVCLNGMVRDTNMRVIHLGERIADNIEFSNRTMQLDSRYQASAIQDVIKSSVSVDSLNRRFTEVQDATFVDIDVEKEIKLLPKVGLTLAESDAVRSVITNNRPDDGVQGENTLWKLVQAVSAVANQESVTATRARELTEVAGKLMNRVSK